ncbi:MAG: pilus assembly protein PilM [Verrucomicrobiota bacterium]
MAKVPNSVIGVDLGQFALKSVLLQRRGADRFIISNYAARSLPSPVTDAEGLAIELKALLKEMGGSAKACAVAISSSEALIRIIEQPQTPTDILREALRLNGMLLLNQDCRSFVLDCDLIESSEAAADAVPGEGVKRLKYLVGGVPRTEVVRIADAFDRSGVSIGRLQLAPMCTFNAFEFAHPEIFNQRAFFLVDIGHTSSTVMVGSKREMVLVRSIDCGGRLLMETLMALSGESREAVSLALEHEDELMVENARMALAVLTREIGSSIGFFEGRREEVVDRIFVSGAPAKSKALLKVMSEEVRLPCESWNALAHCEVMVAADRIAPYNAAVLDLNVACGAAAEMFQAR